MKVMVKVMIMMMMIVERGKGRATMLFARGSRLIIPQSNNILTLLKLDSETVVAVDDMLCFILFKQFCTDFFFQAGLFSYWLGVCTGTQLLTRLPLGRNSWWTLPVC